MLLVLARTSGWSENPVYPLIGLVLLGVATGGILKALTGRHGMAQLMLAIGFGAGGFLFGNVVVQALLWVGAASLLGSSLQSMRRT